MILAVTASGRRHANSSILAEAALSATLDPIHKTVDLARLSFRGCLGCGTCRKNAPRCVQKDDLSPVLADLEEANAVILAAPNYYGQVNGIFKSFLDRWYGFRDGERNLRLTPGRNLLFIFSQGHPDPEAYGDVKIHLDKIFRGYGFTPSFLIGAGLEKAGDAALRTDLLEEARRLGRLLTPSAEG